MPLRDSPTVVLGHGGGGRLSGELVQHVFVPAFASDGAASAAHDTLRRLGDAAAAGGVYQMVPHLGIDPVGGVWDSKTRPGGSAGVGFDYWLLGTRGISAEFEYNFLDSGGEDIFSYFAMRVSYSIIKM